MLPDNPEGLLQQLRNRGAPEGEPAEPAEPDPQRPGQPPQQPQRRSDPREEVAESWRSPRRHP